VHHLFGSAQNVLGGVFGAGLVLVDAQNQIDKAFPQITCGDCSVLQCVVNASNQIQKVCSQDACGDVIQHIITTMQ